MRVPTNRSFPFLVLLLLLLPGCREKEEQKGGAEPVISLEILEVQPFQASIQVKTLEAATVAYGVGMDEDEAMLLDRSAATASTGRSVIRIEVTGLTPSSVLMLCARGIGPSGEKGEVKKISFTTPAAEGGIYPWESARTKVPFLADMTLIPGPSSHRNPLEWSKDRWKTHVAYTDEDGVEHWLFDSFLLIEGGQTGVYGGTGYTYVLTESETPSATKDQWQELLDFWFDGGTFLQQESWWGDGVSTFGRWYSGRMVSPSPHFDDGQLTALDECIDEVAARIGAPPSKRYIVMALPEPIYFDNYIRAVRDGGSGNTVYWGEADDRRLDFSRVSDRVRACRWFIDETRLAFVRKGYRNIELAGFYILPEVLSLSWRAEYKKYDEVLPAVASYLHTFNEGLYWIPYNMAEGYDVWRNFGIDIAYMQPNYYWDETGKNPMVDTFREINKYGMGLELEFEYSMVENVNGAASAEKYRARFDEYLSWAKSSGVYGSRSIALYSGTDAMEQLALSPLEGDREMYHKLGHFIIESPLKSK